MSGRPHGSWGMGAPLGVAAVVGGLGFAELVVATSPELRSPLVSVGDAVIQRSPTWLTRFGIDQFGSNNKAALVIGISVLLGVAGAVVGWAALRYRHGWVVAVAAVTALGVLGVAAARSSPEATWTAVLPSTVTAVVSLAVVLGGWWWCRREDATDADADDTDTATVAAVTPGGPADAELPPVRLTEGVERRQLLLGSAAVVAIGATAGLLGNTLQRRFSNAAARAAVVLPRPRRRLVGPPADPAAELTGLTPLFTPTGHFYRVDTALVVPSIDPAAWQLTVTGMVDRELTFTYEELLDLPMIETDITLCCVSNEVGGSLVGNARWLGTRLDDLLERAGVHPDADQVMGYSTEGFTAGFPVAALDGRDAIVAVGMNDDVLPTRYGFPARLVVPGLYGYVSATKWLTKIELTRFDLAEGYWVPRGWAREAPVKTQSRIDRPRGGAIDAGPFVVAGVAWAPVRGVDRVEVQIDDGPWQQAELGPTLGEACWRQWWVDWDATPGSHTVRCRATDGTGATQPEEASDLAPDGATGWHSRGVTVV